MKIIITGAAGFIGSHLCNYLNKRYDILGVDNLSYGYKEMLEPNVSFYEIGFENIIKEYLNEFDVLIHCATISIQHAYANTEETYQVNILKASDLFRKFKGKIIYLSSASIYGNKTNCKEDDPPQLSNAYDSSKFAAELFLRQRDYYTTLRLSNVYGPTLHGRKYQNVIESFYYSDKAIIQGDGKQTRDFTYISDVIRAIDQCIIRDPLNAEINIGTGIETSLNDLARLMSKNVKYISRRSGDIIQNRSLNIQKAKQLLNWQPKFSLSEGLKNIDEIRF